MIISLNGKIFSPGLVATDISDITFGASWILPATACWMVLAVELLFARVIFDRGGCDWILVEGCPGQVSEGGQCTLVGSGGPGPTAANGRIDVGPAHCVTTLDYSLSE